MKKVIVTTGGTGGHIFPALAVVEEIKQRFPDCDVLFMGGQYGPEAKLANDARLKFVGLPVRGVLGRGLRAIPAAFGMLYSIVRAMLVMRSFKPEIVIGFGGYAAFAGVTAATLCFVPTALHEQNSVPGLTNRILGKMVRKVFLSFGKSTDMYGDPKFSEKFMRNLAKHIKTPFAQSKIVFTGNPVRADIVALGAQKPEYYKHIERQDSNERHLFIMGGSLGAKGINDAIMEALPQLLAMQKERGQSVAIVHQTGKADFERVSNAYARAGYDNAEVVVFIDDMAACYAQADLAVCRAGASSIAELTVAGVPSVLIPFPQATHDHQLHNAAFLAAQGGAVLLEQKDISKVDFSAMLMDMLYDSERLESMSASAKDFAHPQAAKNVVDAVLTVIKK
ncbi:MAG: undecaprenyldiphospho-muramoylpentapeptide beta-N-acetylglucosaminyltransferase [Pseudomonadota bacterium]